MAVEKATGLQAVLPIGMVGDRLLRIGSLPSPLERWSDSQHLHHSLVVVGRTLLHVGVRVHLADLVCNLCICESEIPSVNKGAEDQHEVVPHPPLLHLSRMLLECFHSLSPELGT